VHLWLSVVSIKKGGDRKIRLAIASKRKGKSGGARVITCVLIEDTEVHLLTIYDKSEKEDISDKELKTLRNQVGL